VFGVFDVFDVFDGDHHRRMGRMGLSNGQFGSYVVHAPSVVRTEHVRIVIVERIREGSQAHGVSCENLGFRLWSVCAARP
jgi:hypothetical protein